MLEEHYCIEFTGADFKKLGNACGRFLNFNGFKFLLELGMSGGL